MEALLKGDKYTGIFSSNKGSGGNRKSKVSKFSNVCNITLIFVPDLKWKYGIMVKYSRSFCGSKYLGCEDFTDGFIHPLYINNTHGF